ncbi:MAG: efflux RND transporter periplasmic adaptor subunit [Opitutales bacterium]
MKKISLLIFSFIALVVSVLLFSQLWTLAGDESAREEEESPASSALNVRLHEVEPSMLEERIVSTGTVRASEEVTLQSEVSGIIRAIHFEEGVAVQRGDLLVKFDHAELQAQLRRARYRKDLAESREARQRSLVEQGGASRDEYEAIVNELNILRAEIELIEVQIEKTELRAPFEGIIGFRNVSEGSYITPSVAIATLQSVDPVKVDFSVPERYLSQIRTGMKIEFRVTGMEDLFEGEVYAFEPRIDSSTRTLSLRAISPNEDHRLLPGAFARIEMIIRENPEAVMIPSIALIPSLNRQEVFVYEDGKAQIREVRSGIRRQDFVEIIEGLDSNDIVITSGLQQMRDGMDVQQETID